MSYPTDPKTLKVLDRVIEVLKGIVEGTDYFYSVGTNAVKGIVALDELRAFPYDMVYLGPEDREPENLPDGLVRKYVTIQIEGYVDKLREADLPTALIKHVRDVQKAVSSDIASGAGDDSLGGLCAYADIGMVVTDDGMLAGDGLGMAGFKLSVMACIEGSWGDL